MFKITKLRISGFKSFPFPKELEISDGITGIIGPNGCGKSNIFEAIRWVMGESSSKSLRSNSMDEVIFSGTDKIPSKNIAEVSLEIESTKSLINSEFLDGKFKVSRLIERGVGSFYKINNKDVRAKDVSILFSDSGSGPRSSSIISQGNIDQIINFKPLERKVILEDAAGISGLQSRRHDSELKLNATERNLERISDNIDQLQKQVQSLKRQAKQAENYHRINNNIKINEKRLLFYQWKKIDNEIINNKQKYKKIYEQLDHLDKKIKSFDNLKKKNEGEIQTIDIELLRIQKKLNEENIVRESLINKKESLVYRKKEITKYVHALINDKKIEEKRFNEICDNIKLINLNLEKLGETKELKNKLDIEKNKELKILDAISDLESKLFSEMQLSLGKEFKNDNIKETKIKLENKKKELNKEISLINVKKRQLEEIFKKKSSTILQEEINHLKKKLNEKNKQIIKNEKNISIIFKHKEKQKKNIEILLHNLTRNKTELATLQNISKLKKLSNNSILNKVKINKGFEKSVYAALNYELDAEINKSTKYWISKYSGNLNKLPKGLTPLSSYIQTPEQLKPILSQIGIVKNKKEGFQKQKLLEFGQIIVSASGEFWRWDGLYSEKDNVFTEWLEHNGRLKELNKNIFDLSQRLEIKKNEIQKDLINEKQFLNVSTELKKDVKEFQTQIAKKIEELNTFNQNRILEKNVLDKMNEKIIFINDQLTKINQELSNLIDQQKDVTKGQKNIEPDHQRDIENSIVNYKNLLSEKQNNINQLNEDILRIEIKSKHLQNGLNENHKRKLESSNQILSLQQRLENLESEKNKLSDDPEIFEKKLSEISLQISNFTEKINKIGFQKEMMCNDLKKVESSLKETFGEKSNLNNDFIRVEENISFNKKSVCEIEEKIFNLFRIAPNELIENSEKKDLSEIDFEQIQNNIVNLKNKRDLIGPVNLRAYIEEKEMAEELNNMISERDDIALAIKKLKKGINEINNEGRNRLINAFQLVNENFSELFIKFFEGGSAHLEIVNSEDPLQTGIEIFAKPPGKKLTSLSLLSGGEKTLTAIALIFSIFLINPSPVCILDEVDAALDDINVEKFCKILNQINSDTKTKFLIITHNKITMSMVDRVYGVTMSQKGVSDLVTVNFNSEEFKKAI